MNKATLMRTNTKIISSVNEPVYIIPYLNSQSRSGLINISSTSFSISLASTMICQIANTSTTKTTSVEAILVNSTVNMSYSLIRNATLTGTLTTQPVYNVNDNFSASTTTTFKSASATVGLSLSGGNTLLQQISMPSVFNPASITPILLKPGSTLYFYSSGLASLSVTVNVVFTEY